MFSSETTLEKQLHFKTLRSAHFVCSALHSSVPLSRNTYLRTLRVLPLLSVHLIKQYLFTYTSICSPFQGSLKNKSFLLNRLIQGWLCLPEHKVQVLCLWISMVQLDSQFESLRLENIQIDLQWYNLFNRSWLPIKV